MQRAAEIQADIGVLESELAVRPSLSLCVSVSLVSDKASQRLGSQTDALSARLADKQRARTAAEARGHDEVQNHAANLTMISLSMGCQMGT
jgi:hypothetical protein